MDLTKMVDPDLEQAVEEALNSMTMDQETFKRIDKNLEAGHALVSSLNMAPCALAISILGNVLHQLAKEKGFEE